jgi:hypothetical protein
LRRPPRLVSTLAVAALVAMSTAGCTVVSRPSPAPVGDQAGPTIAAVTGALATAGLQTATSIRPYRPPEGPLLAVAPRSIVQATLPDDPAHGFIVVYALATEAAAQAAADDQAAYIASGIGRVQFASDAHFVLRVLGPTVVFFWWSPGASVDPRTKDIEAALSTVGTAVEVRA